MYSIFKIIVPSELKLLIISLVVLTFFTTRSGEEKNEIPVYHSYSTDVGKMQEKEFSSYKFFLQSYEFMGPDKETVSLITKADNINFIVPDTSACQGYESENSSFPRIPCREKMINQPSTDKSFNIYIRIN